MMRCPLVWLLLVLPMGVCLSEESSTAERWHAPEECLRITVTQDACRVFRTATNKMIDRMHLRESAERAFAGAKGTNHLDCAIKGIRVEQVTYLESNKVEAVFSCDRIVHR